MQRGIQNYIRIRYRILSGYISQPFLNETIWTNFIIFAIVIHWNVFCFSWLHSLPAHAVNLCHVEQHALLVQIKRLTSLLSCRSATENKPLHPSSVATGAHHTCDGCQLGHWRRKKTKKIPARLMDLLWFTNDSPSKTFTKNHWCLCFCSIP